MPDLIYRHPNPEFLESLGAIAAFLGVSKADAKRAILKDGLPAFRLPEGQFFTSKKCIMAWVLQGYEQMMQKRSGAEGPAASSLPALSPIEEIARSSNGTGATLARGAKDKSTSSAGRSNNAQEGPPPD